MLLSKQAVSNLQMVIFTVSCKEKLLKKKDQLRREKKNNRNEKKIFWPLKILIEFVKKEHKKRKIQKYFSQNRMFGIT
jgi:hypothetical protein